jgi:hypothetical protein
LLVEGIMEVRSGHGHPFSEKAFSERTSIEARQRFEAGTVQASMRGVIGKILRAVAAEAASSPLA